MYLDPDAEKEWDEIRDEVWRGFSPQKQAYHQAQAEAHGLSLEDYLNAVAGAFIDRLNNDPAFSARFLAAVEYKRLPLGADPHFL